MTGTHPTICTTNPRRGPHKRGGPGSIGRPRRSPRLGSTTDSTLAEVAAAHHELAAAANELAEHLERAALTGQNRPASCSFCGLTTRRSHDMIAGPGVSICDQCIELCNEIITEET